MYSQWFRQVGRVFFSFYIFFKYFFYFFYFFTNVVGLMVYTISHTPTAGPCGAPVWMLTSPPHRLLVFFDLAHHKLSSLRHTEKSADQSKSLPALQTSRPNETRAIQQT